MKRFLTITALIVFLPLTTLALDLDAAKSKGLVGETPGGYLELVSPPASADVNSLLNEINQKRKKQYQKIAKKNGTELRAVERLAGKKAIEKTAPGNFYKNGGNWVRK